MEQYQCNATIKNQQIFKYINMINNDNDDVSKEQLLKKSSQIHPTVKELQNIVYFHSGCKKEAFFSNRKSEDFRLKVESINQNTFQQYLGQLEFIQQQNRLSLGTGILITVENYPNCVCVLTAAHNIVTISGRKQDILPNKEFRFYHQRCGINKYLNIYEGISGEYYTEYRYENRPCDGFDIGFIWLNNQTINNVYVMKRNHNIEDLKVQKGETICVIGYPGEKQGYLYYMEGRIQQIEILDNDQILLFYNIDTTPGQAGSPVFLKRNNEWILIGIHVGYDELEELNLATGINRKHMERIQGQFQNKNSIYQKNPEAAIEKPLSTYLGQLLSRNEKDQLYLGTGTLVKIESDISFIGILTAQENIMNINRKRERVPFLELKFYYQRSNFDTFTAEFKGISSDYHPIHLNNSSIFDDFNLGIIWPDQQLNESAYLIKKKETIENLQVQKGEIVCIAGYPAMNQGELYEKEGRIEKIEFTNEGQILIYYQIETMPGLTGAPIFLKRNNKWILIALHYGQDDNSNCRIGTGLNNKSLQWLMENFQSKISSYQNQVLNQNPGKTITYYSLTSLNQLEVFKKFTSAQKFSITNFQVSLRILFEVLKKYHLWRHLLNAFRN